MLYDSLAAFSIYFGSLILFGLYFYTKNKNDKDFILANRSLNYWVTAISAQASDMSDWLFMGLPGVVFAAGLVKAWIAIGLVIGMYCNWQFVAPRLRRETEKYDALTLSTYFERRLNDWRGMIRIISAVFALVFFTFYLSAELVGLGRLFVSLFGISYHTGIILGAGIAFFYTMMGGLLAVAWSDLFQGLFLLGMIMIVPIIAFFKVGGLSAITHAASMNNVSLSLLPDISLASLSSIVFLIFGWGLGYFGQPHILINFMSIKDPESLPKSKTIGITWQILALSAAVAVGLIAIPFFGESGIHQELVYVEMVRALFSPFLASFVLCGVIAATMSTMNSQLIVSASTLSEDLYKRFINPHAGDKQLLLMSRICMSIISLTACALSWSDSSMIMDLVGYAWSGLGSTFGPIILLCLYSTTINAQGAIAGMLVGGITAATFPLITKSVMPLIPGFTLGLVTTYVVSKLQKK